MNIKRGILPVFGVAIFAALILMVSLPSYAGQRDVNIPDATGVTGGNAGGTWNSTIASQTCDTQVWKTMEARARIETEREIMQNQNLIFKPDSILSYICFDKFAGHASENVGVLFTHTNYWQKEIIQWGAPNGMDNAMQKVVIESMKPYISGNFNHAYLGGRGGKIENLGKPPETSFSGKGGTYSCGEMAKVWAAAKCLNFMHNDDFAKTDGFHPFVSLKGMNKPDIAGYDSIKEVRTLPTACGGNPIHGSTWEQAFRTARNENSFGDPNEQYQFGQPLQKNFKDVRQKIAPASEVACGEPVKTGIKVILSPGNSKTHDDGVCTNPGCVLTNYNTCSKNEQTAGSARPGEAGM
jgi:hypothetical protein